MNDQAPAAPPAAQAPPAPKPPEPADPAAPEYQHRRTGKIARLPKNIRDQINTLIQDGTEYKDIRAIIGEPMKDITDNNLSRWATQGGYPDWLREQRLVQETRVRQEVAMDYACREGGSRIHEATLQLTATTAASMLRSFELTDFRVLLQDDPAKLIPFMNALARISDAELRCERHRLDREQRAADSSQKPLQEKPPGLSTHTRETLEKELSLM